MLDVKMRGLHKLKSDLEKVAKRALPYAARDALNSAAFEARRQWGKEIEAKFTLRNTFTSRTAIQVRKATGTRVDAMEATVGSIAPYMGLQEEGGTVTGHRGNRAVPAPAAAGQAPGGKRTRLVRAGLKMSALNPAKAHGLSKRQRNAAAIAIAKRTGKKSAVLDRPKGGKGLFAVGGGRKRIKTRLLWDFSERSRNVPAHPTLGPVMRKLKGRMPDLYKEALIKQLRRRNVFGY